MTSTLVPIVVDTVLAVLLVGAMVVSWMVYRRLDIIRNGQAEMQKLVSELNQSVVQAQQSVTQLRQAAKEAESTLGISVRKAQALSDELTLITEAGNNLADRIEKGLTNRPASAPNTVSSDAVQDDGSKAGGRTSADGGKDQKSLLAALREAR
ncbi:DUF6468 domain-containing protein [Eilatimonas milleporae]|uniref:DUF6468 domain-containing protein n=1 Tax=Eilatimonas milleporae TaxID=911205 RepID=A0A3M0CH41_9PROT|nr:DUF6468 domain-containing protein [Eilatimonas milleporae]RMB08944.1 hypothetical protein BXY39_1591 [Eilatimonas milleporae]